MIFNFLIKLLKHIYNISFLFATLNKFFQNNEIFILFQIILKRKLMFIIKNKI